MKNLTALSLGLVFAFAAACGGAKGAGTVRDDCRCEDGCLQACDGEGTTHYKTVSRTDDGSAPDSSGPQEPWEPATPAAAGRELDGDERSAALSAAKLDSGRVFLGDFATASGDEYLVVSGERVEVRELDGGRVARKSLAVDADSLKLVQLVDERIDIVAVVEDAEEAGESRRFVVLRIIGESVAEVFVQKDIGVDAIDFVRRGEQWGIRVNADGETSDAVYEWNPWEGMFRVPRRAPTAPLN